MASLARVSLRFDQYCARLDAQISHAISLASSDPVNANAIVSYCVFRLHDQWNARCRELILKSSTGRYTTASGVRVTRAAKGNPLETLRAKWRSGRGVMDNDWEPDWHVPSTSIRAASILLPSNQRTISDAIAATTMVDELRLTRNAIAHDLPRTHEKFRALQTRYSVSQILGPADFAVLRIAIAPGVTLMFDKWIKELRIAISAATK